MKVSRYHKMSALFMAFLVMCSSVSFSIDMHFCGDELQSFAFLGKANKCDKEKAVQEHQEQKEKHACCHKKETTVQKVKSCHRTDAAVKEKKCCHNKSIHIEAEHDAEQPLLSQQIVAKVATVYVALAFHYNFDIFATAEKEDYYHYKEPVLITDTQVKYQVFRI